MSENVVSIDKNLNICDCLRMMYKDNLSRIPVTSTNENKKSLVGIISEKDIANKLGSVKYGNLAPSHFHVSTVMVKDLITVDADDDLTDVANILIEKNIGAIPVLSDGEMVGIVTKSDFIYLCKAKAYEKVSVKDIMTPDIISISANDRLIHARKVIMDSGVGRLLLTEDNELAGIITSKDIAKALVSFRKHTPEKHMASKIKELVAGDYMSTNVQTISEDTSIPELADAMLETGYNGYPVVDSNDQIIGIVTQSDLLKLIYEMETQ
ncbi:CBS domain-containing protein [Methanobrevibacter ruminantium]|nr:CBS domain-containing protein [Methanobrevibacter ruminantium]